MRRAVQVATLLSFPLGLATSQGMIIPRCPVPLDAPAARIACRPADAGIVRSSSKTRVRLVDRVLHYEVDEEFTNRGGRVGEADYLFPLPRHAAFQDLKLSIDGDLVSGETMDAATARRIYEEIVRQQRDPALVEWMGHGLLRTRIFPIAPGERRRVVVRYSAVATREGESIRIDLGGAASTRDGSSREMVLELPANGVGRVYSPTHSLEVERGRLGRTEVRVRGDASGATLLVPLARSSSPSIAALTHAPGGEAGFTLVTVAPPSGMTSDRALPRDLTLVIDVSGSMQGVKLRQAREAGRSVLETLRPGDRFRLVEFSTDVRTLPAGGRSAFLAVTDENLREARRYLDGLDAEGSTNIEAALREAMRPAVERDRLPLVLFMTDGAPTVGLRQPDQLVDLVRDRVGRDDARRRIFTFGVGADVNAMLVEQLALEGAGTSQFVRPEESVERAVGLVASRLVDPILTDVRITTDGPVTLTQMLMPGGGDLFAGQDLVAFARYRGAGSARLTIEGRRGSERVRWTQMVNFPREQREDAFVARLWATQRVGYLAAEKRRRGGSTEIDAEIRALGERYGIPTEFTSYFVKEPGMQLPAAQAQGKIARGVVGGTPRAVTAPPPVAAFEAARDASAQRATLSLAQVDSMRRRGSAAAEGVFAGGRWFRERDSVWTDDRPAESRRIVTIAPYSQAYFDLVAALPEIRPMLAVGDRVRITGRGVQLLITDDRNAARVLTPAELQRIVRDW